MNARDWLRSGLVGWLACAGTLCAKEAQVIFNCVSVRLAPATSQEADLTYRLEATTASAGTINDELGVSEDEQSPRYYATQLVFHDPSLLEPLRLDCRLDVADPGDRNINGISDFFEVDFAVHAAASAGEFVLNDGVGVYQGTLSLIWERDAGFATGACQLTLEVPDLGLYREFLHTFEVFDYRGALAYTVQGTNIPAEVNLSRLGASGGFHGPLPLTRVSQEELQYSALAWTNELDQVIRFYSSADLEIPIVRGGRLTNYYGIFATDDGRPGTPTSDEYSVWLFHVFDANDSDQDGIADLSDTPPLEPPRLGLRLEDKVLKLQISTSGGSQLVVEQTPSLLPADWQPILTVPLPIPTQEIDLPPPATATSFWRARVE